ncbi:type II toxin-antitoxin system HipA family toxin [Azonexus caeni]|jgi:serine/threonine-protein kinase HipA|uniref:type II toxin-antitoxin system HipA family toxin n=1 Tax=Azonexus caeni TaxID=266126 RepID=UPI003A8B97EB
MASVRDLIVFAYLAGTENRFVPAGRLTLTETPSPNPAARELASAFAYGTRYIERPDSFELDPVSLSLADRAAVRGQLLYPVNALPEFGGLRDAAPDAWGRRVIEARRRVPANTLTEADYLLEAGGDRVGALDVRAALDAPPRPSASDLRSLEYLLQAAEAVEAGLPVPAQLMDILGAGSSAGGARPKATVRDDEGGLWLAKFPARNDTFDVARAEACTLELARNCGLTVPEVRHCDIGQRSVMLIRRFDRFWAPAGQYPAAGPLHETRPGRQLIESRLPFVSGLTLVGCSEYESPDKSYGDLARAIRRYVHPERIARDNEELFARMVFNIFVSNDDDHLRNHGFIRDPRLGGWQLSPLYDVVPRPGLAFERRLHLHIGAAGKTATLDNALSHATAFLADRAAAIAIIRRVWGEIRQWKTVFETFGAPGLLIDQLTSAFRPLEEIASSELVKEVRRGR